MKNNVEYMAKGEIEVSGKEPIIIPDKIDLSIPDNNQNKFDICIKSPNEKPLKCIIYSDSYRVKITNSKCGGRNITVGIVVDTFNINTDFIAGEIVLISNLGEYKIPYRFKVIRSNIYDVLYKLKDKMDFAIIAKEDINTAVTIFDCKEFINAPFMQREKLYPIYKIFRKQNNREVAVEEFLIAIGAKEPVNLIIKDEEISIKDIDCDKYINIEIKRNFFGYIQISVENDDDFIQPDKRYINDKDFIDDVCNLKVKILHSKLTDKRHTSYIVLKSTYEEKKIRIYIINESSDSKEEKSDISIEANIEPEKRRYIEDKNHFISYTQYRLKYEYCIEERSILAELMLLELDYLNVIDDNLYYSSLLKAEAYLFIGKETEAKKYIDDVTKKISGDISRCEIEHLFVKYLLYLMNKNEVARVELVHEAERLAYKYNNDFVFYISVRLKEIANVSDHNIYEYLREEYSRGNRSRLISIELLKLLNRNNEYLHEISDFELKAFNLGMRLGIVSDKLAKTFADRTLIVRTYSSMVMNILEGMSKKYSDNIFLLSLCSYIVRFNIKGNKANNIILQCMDNDIEVKGMYDHYIKNIYETDSKPLGIKVYQHYMGQTIFDAKIKEMLYANILRFVSPDIDIYKAYINDIERFALSQIGSKTINRHLSNNLSYIYRKVFTKSKVDKQIAYILPTILKSYELICNNENIDNIIVKYYELDKEYIYRLNGGEVFLPIYLDNAMIFAEDKYGNRYKGIKLKLFGNKPDDEVIRACYEFDKDNITLLIEDVRHILRESVLNEEMIIKCEKVLDTKEISDNFKHDVFIKLLENYRDNYKLLIQDNAWNRSEHDNIVREDKHAFSYEDKKLMAEAAISMGCYMEAYELIKKYKLEDIDIDKLKELCERIIGNTSLKQDDVIDYLAFKVFSSNKASTLIVDYLCKNYDGANSIMYSILQNAVIERVDTHDLAKRLMVQLLFTKDNRYMERCFSLCDIDDDDFILIAKAYYTYRCFEYVVNEGSVFKEIILYIEDILRNGDEYDKDRMPVLYQLTLLKYYSDKEEIDNNIKIYLSLYLHSLIAKGIIFPFFKNYERMTDLSNSILDKEILIYVAKKNEYPQLYSYVYTQESEEIGEVHMEKTKLRNMYLNVYVAENMLFEGDIWKYKIVDKNDDSVLKCSQIRHIYKDNTIASRYNSLNELISNDEEYKKKYVGRYIVKDRLCKDLFNIV